MNIFQIGTCKANDDVTKLVDTCGTGGDKLSTFNISTASAFCIAAHGVKVAKHGGKMVSSVSGSADILNNLGVKIDLDTDKVKNLIYKVNLGFLFAPIYHDAMKSVASIRKNLGVRTIFNLLGLPILIELFIVINVLRMVKGKKVIGADFIYNIFNRIKSQGFSASVSKVRTISTR